MGSASDTGPGPTNRIFGRKTLAFEFYASFVIRSIWRRRTPRPVENQNRGTSSPMALRLAVQALSATLSPAETAPPNPPRSGQMPAATSRRRLATIASTALLASSTSQLLAPASARGAGAFDNFDLRITVPEQSSEEAEAVVRTHARNLLRVKRLIDAGAWREMQAELRASASNLKQDLYAIIQASPASQRPELRRLYSDLFDSVTSLDYAARDKDEVHVQEHYANIVTSLDEIFAKIN